MSTETKPEEMTAERLEEIRAWGLPVDLCVMGIAPVAEAGAPVMLHCSPRVAERAAAPEPKGLCGVCGVGLADHEFGPCCAPEDDDDDEADAAPAAEPQRASMSPEMVLAARWSREHLRVSERQEDDRTPEPDAPAADPRTLTRDELLRCPVGYLDINLRAANALQLADVTTVAQLVAMTREQVAKLKNMNDHATARLVEDLAVYGLALAADPLCARDLGDGQKCGHPLSEHRGSKCVCWHWMRERPRRSDGYCPCPGFVPPCTDCNHPTHGSGACSGGPSDEPEDGPKCACPTAGPGFVPGPSLDRCLSCSEGVLDSRLGGMCGDHPAACPKPPGLPPPLPNGEPDYHALREYHRRNSVCTDGGLSPPEPSEVVAHAHADTPEGCPTPALFRSEPCEEKCPTPHPCEPSGVGDGGTAPTGEEMRCRLCGLTYAEHLVRRPRHIFEVTGNTEGGEG